MKEELLHYVWRMGRFDLSDLQTTKGLKLEVLQRGEYNRNAGPDFFNARLRIGPTLWAGNVEMHLRASDWYVHRHEKDKAYDNVILHVVLEEDRVVRYNDGREIPCLVLKERIPKKLVSTYQRLINNEYWIPCQVRFPEVPSITKDLFIDRLLIERLEEKIQSLSERLHKNGNDWEESFYQVLAGGFGLKINSEPFIQLAECTPLRLLRKHRDRLFQLEALLFGQAGLLSPELEDDYPSRLYREYEFLRKKYQLFPLQKTVWKFSRLRPANFPTIRMAQLASMIYATPHLFSKVFAIKNFKEIRNMFDLKLSHYWYNHYVFDKLSRKREKNLGVESIKLIVINVISPMLFLYGQKKAEDVFKEQAQKLLEELPSEKNRIIREWNKLGMIPESAFQSQALLQLKNAYCNQKKCLECAIGNHLFRK